MDQASERILGPDAQLPARAAANEERVRRDFWPKLKRLAARLPFAHDLAAAYYCAVDPETPFRVRATAFAALAYFVMPFDMMPDMLALVGFTDDAAVIVAALSMISAHMKPRHREQAAAALAEARNPAS